MNAKMRRLLWIVAIFHLAYGRTDKPVVYDARRTDKPIVYRTDKPVVYRTDKPLVYEARRTEKPVAHGARRTEKPVVFPQEIQLGTFSPPPITIPETVFIQMKNVHNVSDFISRFASVPAQAAPTSGKDGTAGGESIIGRKQTVVGLSGNTISQAASCETSLQVVELEKPRDPTIVYWPMCSRVARCSGCCTSDLLECVASKKTKVSINVLEAKYTGGEGSDSFQPIGVKTFKLEKHDKCQCQCKERAEHCGPLQIYRAEECRCLCINNEAQAKCNTPDKFWDLKDCACKCKSVNECSTGLFYNPTSCRCENLRSPLRPSIVGRLLAAPRNETQDISTLAASDVDPFRDDGGENDGHRRRYIGIRPQDSEGIYSLARKRIQGRTRTMVPVNVTSDDL